MRLLIGLVASAALAATGTAAQEKKPVKGKRRSRRREWVSRHREFSSPLLA